VVGVDEHESILKWCVRSAAKEIAWCTIFPFIRPTGYLLCYIYLVCQITPSMILT